MGLLYLYMFVDTFVHVHIRICLCGFVSVRVCVWVVSAYILLQEYIIDFPRKT